jgi:hypothetical protein
MGNKWMAAAALAIAAGLAGTWVSAAANLDLSDFNEDVMRDLDDTVKSLDSNIALKDAKSAGANIQSVQDGLRWAEDYFVRKGNVPDAVKLAKRGEDLAVTLGKSVASNDFDTALSTYDSLMKTCRACHDAYKPPEL